MHLDHLIKMANQIGGFFESMPDADTLAQSVDAIPPEVWFADANGTPDHRKHLAKHYAEELRTELGGL